MSLDEASRAHLADSYPHNHDYRVVGADMRPKWKLWKRWRRLRRHWPSDLDSFLDIGCSKGFFVLQAAHRGAEALGIDIHAEDLAACEAAREHLKLESARFQHKTLEVLADDDLRSAIEEGLDDIAAGRIVDHEELWGDVEAPLRR